MIQLCFCYDKLYRFVFGVDNATKTSQIIFPRDKALRGKKIIVY